MARWSGDARTAATAAALTPYAWRDLTDRMLARLVVGAADRHGVTAFLASLPGTDPGPAGAAEPTGPDDPRVEVLLRVLADRPWRGLTLDRLVTDLFAALDAWQAGRGTSDRDLRRPSGER
ncbi:hypothetical protein GCM10027451_16790 [Geodermatophilus aquaeductus]|uniref:Uncharacterized protein n=1 Tax=Geodermatophilus aquaeductus TaxID=1564161 RepID=A0A521E0X1_9ACTN|nr:hypothetical protein [Geodermatophilus aquaeductus]SMO77604.1 hypothetical protein SAMN06273567_10496 [Geodermatophilus aquaeductus]